MRQSRAQIKAISRSSRSVEPIRTQEGRHARLSSGIRDLPGHARCPRITSFQQQSPCIIFLSLPPLSLTLSLSLSLSETLCAHLDVGGRGLPSFLTSIIIQVGEGQCKKRLFRWGEEGKSAARIVLYRHTCATGFDLLLRAYVLRGILLQTEMEKESMERAGILNKCTYWLQAHRASDHCFRGIYFHRNL